MVGIFISGLSGMSSGSNPGTHQMADDATIKNNVTGDEVKVGHSEHDKAIKAIEDALKKNPCEPVVIIGHSYGGDSAIEIAEKLKEKGICVDLLIQIDTVGAWDDVLPSNVTRGVNIWSTSKKGINGESKVEGSENIGIDNTTHTDIDENPVKSNKVGSSNDPKYKGKNAWDLVKDFTSKLPELGCNCPKHIRITIEGMKDLQKQIGELKKQNDELKKLLEKR